MQPRKQKGIIFLFNNQLVYFADHLPKALSFPFKPEVIQHLDVINRELLITQIKAFIETNKLPPALLSIVAHDSVLFQKTFVSQTKTQQTPVDQTHQHEQTGSTVMPQTPTQTIHKPVTLHVGGAIVFSLHLPGRGEKKVREEFAQEQQKDIQTFIDSVPFEEVTTKIIKVPQGQLVVAGNKDLFISIKEAFELSGFSTDGVYPFPLFKDISVSQGLTPQVCLQIIDKIDTVKQQSMQLISQNSEILPEGESHTKNDAKTDKKRFVIMLSIFAILIIFMVWFYFKTDAENKKLMNKQFTPTVIPQVSPITSTTSPTIVPPTQSAGQTVTIQTVSIQIVSSSNSATLTNQVRNTLLQAGYKKISLSNQASLTQGRVFVLFAPVVPLSLRESIISEIKKISGVVSSQESTTITEQVVITL